MLVDNYDEENQGVTIEGEEESKTETTPSAESDLGKRMEPQKDSKESSKEQTKEPGKDSKDTTDRGTKVAKEPESQYYQQLKNQLSDARELLGNPSALREYLRRVEGTPANKQGEEEISDIAEKVMTPDGQVDLYKLDKYIDERMTKKIEKGLTFALDHKLQARDIEKTYEADKNNVRAEHPELDPANKEKHDPDMERLVSERFIAQGGYEGKVTLKQVVDQTYQDIAKWTGRGRKQAETEIVRKRAGAINQSKVSAEDTVEEENMSPEDILASRVQRQMKG